MSGAAPHHAADLPTTPHEDVYKQGEIADQDSSQIIGRDDVSDTEMQE